jgi:hypothetical protein
LAREIYPEYRLIAEEEYKIEWRAKEKADLSRMSCSNLIPTISPPRRALLFNPTRTGYGAMLKYE